MLNELKKLMYSYVRSFHNQILNSYIISTYKSRRKSTFIEIDLI